MVKEQGPALTRRGFVKGAAFAGALVAAGTAAGCSPKASEEAGEGGQKEAPEEQVYLNSCHGNCGRSCAWDVTVRDGYIVNAEPHCYDDDPENVHRGGCNRGLLNIQRIYDADRLKYPMKRALSARCGTYLSRQACMNMSGDFSEASPEGNSLAVVARVRGRMEIPLKT